MNADFENTVKTAWDCCLSENAQEFFKDQLDCAKLTSQPFDPMQLVLPLQDLAEMARQSLLVLTDGACTASDFESVSDCGHMAAHLPVMTGSPIYATGILNVLSTCLHILNEIDSFNNSHSDMEGMRDVISNRIEEIFAPLQQVDQITEERWGPERETVKLIPFVKRDAQRQEGTKKPKRPEVNDWIEKKLKADNGMKSPELWGMAPDWITDQIGIDRFKKRVTAVRKELKGRK